MESMGDMPTPNGVEIIHEEPNSLNSMQFVGSAFRAPSDAAENPVSGLNIKSQLPPIKGAEGGDKGGDEGWMYEDTEQEEFED